MIGGELSEALSVRRRHRHQTC